ncbi:MAG: outer membrane protein assembly factor BamA [Elusimicrobia bacterium CG11_big_fil_rev_8_21_14_0_20_64_6]|nr:MAG: outer membrane protein assembly factor BamA [Elusimicrobia bacterium CG11_big_fil_rev_8_21_14_0_20_64_6]
MKSFLMSVIAAVVLSSSALGQTASSGTSPSPELSSVSTETAAAAPSISTTVDSSTASSTAAVVSVSSPAADTVAVSSSALPGLTTDYALPAVSTAPAATDSGVVPRPWVIGDIKADGLKNSKLSTIRGAIKGRKGDLYDRPDLDKDIQSLLGLGLFERVGAEIVVLEKRVPEHFRKVAGSDRQILLNFIVKEKPVIRKITFKGNKKLSRGALSDLLSLKNKDPFDRNKLDEDNGKLLSKYHEKGFLDVDIEPEVQTDTAAATVELVFSVVEGAKSRIELIELGGVTAFKPKILLKLMKNKRKKVYFPKDLADDIKKVETHYKNNGFLDVALSSPLVTLSADKTRISIALGVTEGRSYRFGETTFSGNLIYTSSEVAKTVEYRPGKIFSQEKFEETIRGIQELYSDRGRLRTRINPIKSFDPTTDRMNVLFEIVEGPISYVGHVDVEGNKATKTFVLRREIVIKPGDVFRSSRVRRSIEKIRNLGFIDDVDLDLQQTPSDPDKVDLTFDVAEGKPGVLTAGAAYSSVDGLIGTLSLQHLNLFGRAQRASVQWSFGRRVQDYSVSWTTPWLGEHPTSLGFDAYNTRRINPFDTSLSAYVERRTGGSIRLGPRFEEDKYQLNLTYGLARISIQNVQDQFKGVLSEGTSIQSTFSAEFSRDTRDSIWDPARGTRNGIGLQLSGGPFQGDIHFFKPSITNQAHHTLFTVEDWPFVISAYHRGGYVTQFGKTRQVPVQDRFFIGGQDSLRGYSPSGEAGFPQGGKIYSVANVEFGFPLARERKKTIVKFVVFADAGGAWDRTRDFSARIGSGQRDIKTDVGFGLRFVTPAFPIRLDYGYGLNHRNGERLYQINFGLGPLF